MANDNGQFHYSNGGSHLRVDPSMTAIPAGAFRGRTDLTEIELPESIQSIGGYAFCGCRSLRLVHLREGLLTIGERAFAGCTQLDRIVLPSTVTHMHNGAFHACTSLEEIHLCEGLRTIGHMVPNKYLSVFYGCASLRRITIPSTVAVITDWAFDGCTSLEEVHLQEGLQAIEWGAFARCSSLKHIFIPYTVTSIGYWAFRECLSLKVIYLPNSRLSIGSLSGCIVLRSNIQSSVAYAECGGLCLRVDSSVTNIPDSSHLHLKCLTNVELPQDLHEIESTACCGCSLLRVKYLFEGLIKIGEEQFAECTSWKGIDVSSTVTAICDGTFHTCATLDDIGDLREGILTIRRNGESVVGSKTCGVFLGCMFLLSISIPSTVTVISAHAFCGCTSLEVVHLSEGIQTIQGCAFLRCESILSITIPSTVTVIDAYAFADCTSLEAVHLSEGIRAIGDNAFFRCRLLRQLLVPTSVAAIGEGAFRGCTSLKEIHLSECITMRSTATVIDAFAFGECTALEAVHLSEGIQTIEHHAFSGCKSLQRIVIPSTVTVIEFETFAHCTSLNEVHLCEGLQTICERAFYGCISLLHINIPSTVNVIKSDAFEYCSQLRNVIISPSSMLGQACFEGSFANFAEVNCTFDMLRRRFDDLPIHNLCHTLGSNDELRTLIEVIQLHSAHGFPVDCLGMTPLHILACSGNRNIQLYRCYLEIFPDAMFDEDNWSETPLGYVLVSDVSGEILHIFIETCKKRWDVLPFDIGHMLMKCGSIESARHFIQALRRFSPEPVIDWQETLDQSIACKVPLQVFRVLVEASVSARSNCMSTYHQHIIDTRIAYKEGSYDVHVFYLRPIYEDIRRLIIQFTQEFREFLMNASTMLELALWNAVLNELLHQHHPNKNNDRTIRDDLRVNGGQMFQVVIPNVLSFL